MLFKKFVVRTGLSFVLGMVLMYIAFRGVPPMPSIGILVVAVTICNGILTMFGGN